jgi:hypothetical protein
MSWFFGLTLAIIEPVPLVMVMAMAASFVEMDP